MTMTTTPEGRASVGDLLHCNVSGYLFAGKARVRGEEIVLDADMIAGSVNLLGESSIDRELRNPDGRLALGPWPTGEPTWTAGSPDHAIAREEARKAAWAHPDPQARAEALRRVEEVYGPAGPTSRTIGGGSGNERLIEEQRARMDARGKLVWNSATIKRSDDERLAALDAKAKRD